MSKIALGIYIIYEYEYLCRMTRTKPVHEANLLLCSALCSGYVAPVYKSQLGCVTIEHVVCSCPVEERAARGPARN